MMKLIIVGTGNVAWHLARACVAAGHELVAVATRSESSGKEFVQAFQGSRYIPLAEIKDLDPDVVFLTVPDAAIPEVLAHIATGSKTVVVHTSGSQPLSILQTAARAGVFYPVQTFTKYKPVDFADIPILIEGNDKAIEELLMQLAQSLSNTVQIKDSQARKQLHLAAVFACNFTNHLLGISRYLLERADLSTNLLQPLIQETFTKASANDPFTVQTGPASRSDINIIQEHIQQLSAHPSWQELYRQLTLSIQEQQKK